MKNFSATALGILVVVFSLWATVMLMTTVAHAAGGPWYVAPGGDDGNTCLSAGSPCATINGAIGKATPGDTVYVATGVYTQTIGSEVVLLDKNAILSGGWDPTFTSQTGMSAVDGEGVWRGLYVNPGVTAEIDRFSFENGFSDGGTGIFNNGVLTLTLSTVRDNVASADPFGCTSGGGIDNRGTLTLDKTTVHDNSSTGDGGGVANRDTLLMIDSTIRKNSSTCGGSFGGGGLANNLSATATIINSSIISNTANGPGGGILDDDGSLTMINSTVSGNMAGSDGGGIYRGSAGPSPSFTLNNSTIYNNAAGGDGGGISGDSIVEIKNSILAGNSASGIGPDCSWVFTSQGYNLVQDSFGCTILGDPTGILTGVNPLLGPLQDNGGQTLTHALLVGSPAINAGNPAVPGSGGNACELMDQRGVIRDVQCDMGSYEDPMVIATATPTPTNTPTPIPPTPTPTATPILLPMIFVSSSSSGSAGGVSFTDDDILAFDPGSGTWSMVFDGSDVGLTEDLNGFLLLDDGSILMTLKDPDSLPGVSSVDDSDIVQFTPTTLGPNTAGTFSLFFDGSDVGLTTNAEGIDAIGAAPDGSLVISTEGSFGVPGASGEDEDLLVFNVTSFGPSTSGSFELYFDSSDVQLGGEDVEGTWIDPLGNDVYLTVSNAFAVTGASGDGADIFVCAPGSLGSDTSCSYRLFWDGSANGFGGENTDGLSIGSDASIIIPGGGPTPTPTFTPVPPTPTFTPLPPTPTFTPVLPTPTFTPVGPTPTFTPVPPTPTPTPTPIPGTEVLYVSSSSGGTVGGVAFKDEDILAYDTGSSTWAMYIDGSDVGLGSQDLNGFLILGDGSILMTFQASFSLSGLGTVDDSDIVQFFPTSTGTNTAGSFSLYFDGSDVGLSSSSEDIDAIGMSPAGNLVISTVGSFSVSGVSGKDEDLLEFTATTLGTTTSGSFALYFDGSDVGLTDSGEDVGATWIDLDTGEIYLSTQGNFSVTGASGDNADIFICAPGTLGSSTSCTFSLFWDGSANGFDGEKLDGMSITD